MINLIVAVNADWRIDFPTPIGDRRRFKWLTLGDVVLMGRTTWDSLPSEAKPLKNRRNIVLTRNAAFEHDACIVSRDFRDAMRQMRDIAHVEGCHGWIIGGGKVYEQAIASPWVDRVYLTIFPERHGGQVRFPELNPQDWDLLCDDNVGEPRPMKDGKSEVETTRFQVLQRRD